MWDVLHAFAGAGGWKGPGGWAGGWAGGRAGYVATGQERGGGFATRGHSLSQFSVFNKVMNADQRIQPADFVFHF